MAKSKLWPKQLKRFNFSNRQANLMLLLLSACSYDNKLAGIQIPLSK